jgi:integrase/recombinase XerD
MPFPNQRLPRYLTQEQTESFFAAIRELRDRALFTLIYHHGLRVGEVALLQRGDVDLFRGRVLIRRLKGGAWGEQPLFAAAVTLVGRWMAASSAAPSTPLFPGRDGAIQKRRIQALFSRYRDRGGLPAQATCHSLRHSIATHLLDAGVALEVVQDRLGHQSIRSTSIYARITDRHRAALFLRLESSPWIVQPGESEPRAENSPA